MASSWSWSLFIALPLYAAAAAVAAFWSSAPRAVRLLAAISGVVETEMPLALTTLVPPLDVDAVALDVLGGAASARVLDASLISLCGLAIASAGLWVHSEQILSSSSFATRVLFPSLAAATSASTSSMSTSLSMSLTSARISAKNSVGVFSVYATSSSLYLHTCTAYWCLSATRASLSTVTLLSSSLFSSTYLAFSEASRAVAISAASFFLAISSSMRSTEFFSVMTASSFCFRSSPSKSAISAFFSARSAAALVASSFLA
mmetsp:Transcript_11418/g.53068  ORF Transcript_11418/g.53068 Transcript_11418/m.53068 type:complete len:261 (-) Transcript_11418:349-1131(-)